MSYQRPTLTQLRDSIADDVNARLPGADSRLRHSVLSVLVTVFAGALYGVYGLLDWVWRQIFPDTAEGEQLARWSAIWGVTRKPATQAMGQATLTGTNGAGVPVGTELIRSDGVSYIVTAAAVVADGVASVDIRAVGTGSVGNATAGTGIVLANPVFGINGQGVIAAGGVIGGAGEEADEDLRPRLLDRIQRPPHGGNRNDYIQWALAVSEVTRAWVSAGEMGPGTVTLRFVMDGRADIFPTEADIAAVQVALDDARPVTAALNVAAPIPFPIDITLRALPPTPEVQAAIREDLADLFRRSGEPGGTILISHIREAISIAAGEMDHEVIAPLSNVEMETGYLPMLGEVTFL